MTMLHSDAARERPVGRFAVRLPPGLLPELIVILPPGGGQKCSALAWLVNDPTDCRLTVPGPGPGHELSRPIFGRLISRRFHVHRVIPLENEITALKSIILNYALLSEFEIRR